MAADKILEATEEKMMDALEALERDYAGFRTGKASPGLVENIMVDYYGSSTRLRDIAGITTPEPRLIVIQPWDQNSLGAIEKAIIASTLGISPISDGRVIRLPIPELSEERRRALTKEAGRRCEEAKVEIRNHRRDANEEAKKAFKGGDLSEDLYHGLLDDIQELTNNYIKQVDELTEAKEQELMEV
jgi:ribosome recycling factor